MTLNYRCYSTILLLSWVVSSCAKGGLRKTFRKIQHDNFDVTSSADEDNDTFDLFQFGTAVLEDSLWQRALQPSMSYSLSMSYSFSSDDLGEAGQDPSVVEQSENLPIVETGSPTEQTPETPNKAPTGSPTLIPTKGFTLAPTKKTTENPTITMTDIPNSTPTNRPTLSPTFPPTKEPTANPTNALTDIAITIETKVPTLPPTKIATDSPTKAPTNNPTSKGPTVAHTKEPTESPTKAPTDVPTSTPSKGPTLAPTVAPTKEPTESPTKAPTDVPTSTPSKGPTLAPTVAPTKEPTESPTKAPTDVPTSTPSNRPTSCNEISSQDRQDRILSLLSDVSSAATPNFNSASPQDLALKWLIHNDVFVSCLDEESTSTIVQRYVLAVLYFSTSGGNWSDCSASETLTEETCGLKVSTLYSEHAPNGGTKAWLSPVSECEWGGVICNQDTMQVDQIEIGKSPIPWSNPCEKVMHIEI
jgi:hypothetical protein